MKFQIKFRRPLVLDEAERVESRDEVPADAKGADQLADAILESRRIVLLAGGSGKRAALDRLETLDIDPSFPASALWDHEDVTVLVDRSAL